MSNLKYCQSPLCHTYQTQDRLKGTKGNKTNVTSPSNSFLVVVSWMFLEGSLKEENKSSTQ